MGIVDIKKNITARLNAAPLNSFSDFVVQFLKDVVYDAYICIKPGKFYI
jgi:hypothetical protein